MSTARGWQFGRVAGAAAAALLLAMPLPLEAATGQGEAGARAPAAIAPTFGKTLPPIGFVEFCRREPEACTALWTGRVRPHLSARQWDLVFRVNAYVNAAVAPASDQALYGEPEHWAYPVKQGDCEDYALLKQRYLEAMGIGRGALLITVVLDDKGDGHAVLMLAASEGDFVLDNRRNDIRRWGEAGYTFLKRQSERDPRNWVSLTRGTDGSGALAIRSTEP